MVSSDLSDVAESVDGSVSNHVRLPAFASYPSTLRNGRRPPQDERTPCMVSRAGRAVSKEGHKGEMNLARQTKHFIA